MKTQQPGMFETIVQSISDAVVIFDNDGTIHYKNHAAEGLFRRIGYRVHRISDLFTPKMGLATILRNSVANVSSETRVMTQTGEALQLDVSWTTWGTEPDRAYASILRGIENHNVADYPRDPQYTRHIVDKVDGFSNQVRMRRQLEEAIRISGLGHWEWDIVNNQIYWSDQMYRIFGLCPGEIELNSEVMMDLAHPDDRDRLRQLIARRLQLGQTFDTEWRVMRRDGVPRHVHAQGEVFCDASNTPTHMFGTMQDVTDIKRTDELLLRSEKLSALGQLAAGIAHEIRNPLTALKGFTQLLRGSVPQNHQSYLDIMVSELTRIERILSELLVLAKPQAVFFHPNNVTRILDDVLPIISPQALLTNVTIHLDVEPKVPLVNCEPNQLKQVFVNLMKNAIEAMPNGGELTIGLRLVESERVLIEIRDQGLGIPSELIPKLGEPFFTTKEKGTGLGLMTSNKIVTAHHGHLDIQSELGKGTTVSILLPGLIS